MFNQTLSVPETELSANMADRMAMLAKDSCKACPRPFRLMLSVRLKDINSRYPLLDLQLLLSSKSQFTSLALLLTRKWDPSMSAIVRA